MNFIYFFLHTHFEVYVASGFQANGPEALIVWFTGAGLEATETFGLC